MKIAVSRDVCTGHGRCYGHAARDWLDGDDEGYVNICGQEIEVPAGREEDARTAAAMCPEGAITLSP